MTQREFQVRPGQPHDMMQIGTLVGRVFSVGAPHLYTSMVKYAGEGLLQKPDFDTAMCRIGLLNGQIIAHARIDPYMLRYGGASLRVGGLTAVCTHPDHRGQGHAGAVMRDALTYMMEQGVHLALLNTGLNGYYERFGFNSVWPYYYFEVDSAEAASLQSRLKMREARLQDAPQMAALYERHWGGRVTFMRSPEMWLWRLSNKRYAFQVIEDARGQICGYIGEQELNERVEVVVDTPDAAMTLLAEFGRRAQNAGVTQISWLLPPDDLLINYARLLMTVKLSVSYMPSGGWMGRLIDTQGLVETLLPEIVAQAQTVLPDLRARDVQFYCHPDVMEIGLRARKTTFCQLNHHDFTQVMFGSLRPSALAARPHSKLHPDAVRLLEALFPSRMTALAPLDWF